MEPKLRFAAIGLDHNHIYMQVERIASAGGRLEAYYAAADALAMPFERRHPNARRVEDPAVILEDPKIALVLTAAVPSERARIAIEAMRHGKDVMTDKPGATSLEQLEALRRAQAETGRIYSIYYEERFENPTTIRALELVRAGAIGDFVHSLGLGPHLIRKASRPAWFFERARYGGIITDLGSHQCDQFLYLANTLDVDVVQASVANRANADLPELQDIGEVMLRSPRASGYFRLDWFTPSGLPVFGDCRLLIVGTEGTIEVRKYIDLGREGVQPALYLTDKKGVRAVDFSDAQPQYGRQLVADVLDRTETAMSQAHCLKAMEIALRAQALAEQAGVETTGRPT
jgi:predicted dehydrogenase